jgi:hypothetical protein
MCVKIATKMAATIKCDIFDLPDANERFASVTSSSVAFRHPTVRYNLAFGWIWHALLGVYPTKLDFHAYVMSHGLDPLPTINSVQAFIQAHMGVYVTVPQTDAMHLDAQLREFVHRMGQEPEAVHNQILLKWWDRYVGPHTIIEMDPMLFKMSLENAYTDILLKHSRTAGMLKQNCDSIVDLFDLSGHVVHKHKLLHHNKLNGTYHDLKRSNGLFNTWKGKLCLEEALRFCISQDRQLTSDIVGSTMVFLDSRKDPQDMVADAKPLLDACDATSAKPVVVVTHADLNLSLQDQDYGLVHLRLPPVFGFAIHYVPRICSKFVWWCCSDIGSHEVPVGKSSSRTCNIAYVLGGNAAALDSQGIADTYDRIIVDAVIDVPLAKASPTTYVIPRGVVDAPPDKTGTHGYVHACLHSKELQDFFWQTHLKLPCPMRARSVGDVAGERAGKTLLFLQFLFMYCIMKSHDIEKRANEPMTGRKCCMLLVDNRPSMMSVLSALVTSINLSKEQGWDVTVVCTKSSDDFFRTWMPKAWNVNVHVLESKDYPSRKFDIQSYSDLLKSASFWKSYVPHKTCLLIQDDGMLVRPGVERFLEWDYVGAPWTRHAINDFMKDYCNPDFVGNGGLSLRNARVMEAVCSAHEKDAFRLFSHIPQRLPEDVFFSLYCHKDGHKVCPREAATTFAMEQVECMDALGFHKFWPYMDTVTVLAYFEGVLGCRMVSR